MDSELVSEPPCFPLLHFNIVSQLITGTHQHAVRKGFQLENFRKLFSILKKSFYSKSWKKITMILHRDTGERCKIEDNVITSTSALYQDTNSIFSFSENMFYFVYIEKIGLYFCRDACSCFNIDGLIPSISSESWWAALAKSPLNINFSWKYSPLNIFPLCYLVQLHKQKWSYDSFAISAF